MIFVLFSLFFASVSATAGTSCSNEFVEMTNSKEINFKDNFKTLMFEIDFLLGGKSASEWAVIPVKNVQEALFNPFEKQVQIPNQPWRKLEQGEKLENLRSVVFTHEYAHALFDTNLKESSAAYVALIEKVKMLAEREASGQPIGLSKSELKHFNRQTEAVMSLHEVFADLVSASQFNSAAIMTKTIYGGSPKFDSDQWKRYAGDSRDFSNDFSKGQKYLEWVNEYPEMVSIDFLELGRRYAFFSPLRSALWNTYGDLLLSPITRKATVQKIYDFLEDSIEFVLSLKLEATDDLKPKNINETLMSRLD